jgi:hypothetical protein
MLQQSISKRPGGMAGLMVVMLDQVAAAMGALLLVNIPNPQRTAEGQRGSGNPFKEATFGVFCLLAGCLLTACVSQPSTPHQIITDTPLPTATDISQPSPSPVAPTPSNTPGPNFASDVIADGCRIYRNTELGYSFHYPADAKIINNDDPLKSISVIGPDVGGDRWPQYTISHPADREDYRPPEDVDLEKWLTDHNLLAEARQPDMQIAGTLAIHLRFDRSPQSYAYDRYFFAKAGQLYMIVIGHAGDKEDWELYNHFLQSFQFEP